MSHVKTNQDINSSKLTRTAHGKRPDVKAPHTHTLVPDQRSLRPAGRTLAGGRRGLRPCEALLPDYMAAAKEPCNMCNDARVTCSFKKRTRCKCNSTQLPWSQAHSGGSFMPSLHQTLLVLSRYTTRAMIACAKPLTAQNFSSRP